MVQFVLLAKYLVVCIYTEAPILFTCKTMGALYGDILTQTQPLLKYLFSCQCTSSNSATDILLFTW